jgi:hypothetical protein
VLRNRIEDLSILKKLGLVEGEPKKMNYAGKETWLLFPAKLYCGQSLLDSRRESIIIDYFFTDEIAGYQENPDYLAGRRGLKVRDEIRMIRPGFYLGRAYLDRGFALNFTLYDKATDEKAREEFRRHRQGAGRLLARHAATHRRCRLPPSRPEHESLGMESLTMRLPQLPRWRSCGLGVGLAAIGAMPVLATEARSAEVACAAGRQSGRPRRASSRARAVHCSRSFLPCVADGRRRSKCLSPSALLARIDSQLRMTRPARCRLPSAS